MALRESVVQNGAEDVNPLYHEEEQKTTFAEAQVTPTSKLHKRQRVWSRLLILSGLCDLFAIFYFCYQGFYMYEDDKELDPIAWRLAFGVVAILVIFKIAQTVTGNLNYFTVWFILVFFMITGHVYGAVRNFIWVYGQEFPCFLGDQGDEQHGFCYRGEILIGTTTAIVYLIGSTYFIWLWKAHKTEYMYRTGYWKEEQSIDEIIERIDDQLDKYNQ